MKAATNAKFQPNISKITPARQTQRHGCEYHFSIQTSGIISVKSDYTLTWLEGNYNRL